MDDQDQELRAMLAKILRLVETLVGELELYRELLPEPGSLKARILKRKVAASAVDQWNEGSR